MNLESPLEPTFGPVGWRTGIFGSYAGSGTSHGSAPLAR